MGTLPDLEVGEKNNLMMLINTKDINFKVKLSFLVCTFVSVLWNVEKKEEDETCKSKQFFKIFRPFQDL